MADITQEYVNWQDGRSGVFQGGSLERFVICTLWVEVNKRRDPDLVTGIGKILLWHT